MASIEKTIDVDVPVRTAYNQWTQFEEFSQFMAGVKEVRQLDDKRLHWRAEVLGKDVEWLAEITQQIPDERITSMNPCWVCHARLLAEQFESPPIYWPHCPYVEFRRH